MPKRKRKTGMEEATGIVLGFANLVDTIFLKYSGKTLGEYLKEQANRPRELPPGKEPLGKEAAPSEPMPLADAYAVLGLKPGAPLDDVKRNYRNLARAFHSDKGSVMNDEAMKLLNRAYDRITKERK